MDFYFVRIFSHPEASELAYYHENFLSEEAERDLVCDSMLGIVQPGNREGVWFGD